MGSETKPTPTESRRQPVSWRDILFWAGLGLLGVYTFRELTEDRPPQHLKRRPVRFDTRVGEPEGGRVGRGTSYVGRERQ